MVIYTLVISGRPAPSWSQAHLPVSWQAWLPASLIREPVSNFDLSWFGWVPPPAHTDEVKP